MEDMLITYDCRSGKYTCRIPDREDCRGKLSGGSLWAEMEKMGACSAKTAKRMTALTERIAAATKPQMEFCECEMNMEGGQRRWYRVGFLCAVPQETIAITFTDMEREDISKERLLQATERDRLTGLWRRTAFCRRVDHLWAANSKRSEAGEYAMLYFDIDRFKAVNDLFGLEEGDRMLRFVAEAIREEAGAEDLLCRVEADRFLAFVRKQGDELMAAVDRVLERIQEFDLPVAVTCSLGVYVTEEPALWADQMIDRAILAQRTVKGSYTRKYCFYDEEMRSALLGEQEITGMMAEALAQRQFVVYYQPQYNHTTGMLVGAEALVRWKHPERGLISPGVFIPIFEKNGFITQLDFYVFECVCRFLRECMDKKRSIVPISTNFSRHDIFQKDYVGQLEQIRRKYDVPAKYLRVEITETSVMGSSEYVNDVIRSLHTCGYVVEMDDFGSGYSSLNVLKNIELDIIKLDMFFMAEDSVTHRGGTILSSVVRMAKWLGLPVIAEGVETVEQADFLRSIGCDYIQGYLYSRPLPKEDYERLISGSSIGAIVPQLDLIDAMNAGNFWDPKSMETLIFNHYVGGAAIFGYYKGELEVLRVNRKYLQEIGMNMTERDFIESNPMESFDAENRRIYVDMLERAIATTEEQESETWRHMVSACCGEEYICVRSNVRMIGKSGERYLFYAMIRNITAEKEQHRAWMDRERRYKMVSEQVNVYFWEYTIATHEMRPCFRCMRDLGFPPLLTNYPESAFGRGVFPVEFEEEYREWHRQMEKGVESFEKIVPLLDERIPFRVRYTTEFDENGYPVKAYGSAEKVV